MAESKYLDQGGVSHLWDKVKAYLDNRFGTGTILVDDTSYLSLDFDSRLTLRGTVLSAQLTNDTTGIFVSEPMVSINFTASSSIQIRNDCQVKLCVVVISSGVSRRNVINVGSSVNIAVTSLSPYIMIAVPWYSL